MPGKKRSTRIDTLIGRRSVVEGDVHFSGGLHLDGRVNGNIIAEPEANSVLIVSATGVVAGEVRVANVRLHGAIWGNVQASEGLDLSSRAHVEGDVYYNILEMAIGATVNGNLVHHQPGNTQAGGPDDPPAGQGDEANPPYDPA